MRVRQHHFEDVHNALDRDATPRIGRAAGSAAARTCVLMLADDGSSTGSARFLDDACFAAFDLPVNPPGDEAEHRRRERAQREQDRAAGQHR